MNRPKVSDIVIPICNSAGECEEKAEEILTKFGTSERKIKLRQNCQICGMADGLQRCRLVVYVRHYYNFGKSSSSTKSWL